MTHMNGMGRRVLLAAAAGTALVAFLAASGGEVLAGKPSGGGGGGGGGGPAGTIFYFDTPPYTNYTWKMNADGTNAVRLGYLAYFQYPSRTSHGGHTWFLTALQTPGLYYPDGVTVRGEVCVLRDDYSSTNNNSDTRVQLTSDPTLQVSPGFYQGMHWFHDDGTISFRARRWSASGTIEEGGLYTADLVFGTDGSIAGLASQPTAPTLAFPLDASGWPEFTGHSWDPAGTRVAYVDSPATGLWVADLSTGTRTRIFSGSPSYPDWSPAGSSIAFGLDGGINTIRSDGTRNKAVIRPTYLNTAYWSGFAHPYHSPDGSYLTFVGFTSGTGGGGNDDAFRSTVSGGALTNLTNTPANNEIPLAWCE